MGQHDHDGDQARIAALENELTEVRQLLGELRAELRGGTTVPVSLPVPRSAPAAASAPAPAEVATGTASRAGSVSRRGLVVGAAGALAAGAAAAVATSTPAAANGQGQSWTLGAQNNCTTTTTLYSTNVDPTLMITSFGNDGSNAAQFYVHDANGSGAVTHHETAGLGPAAEFINQNANNTTPTVNVQTDGKGPAGTFVQSSTASNSNALGVLTNGTGNAFSASAKGGNAAFLAATGTNAALFVTMSGGGNGAFINHTNTTTGNPGAFVQVAGPAPAIRAKGPVTNLNLWPRTGGGAPTADTAGHGAGDLVEDAAGNLWICVGGGTPGQWRKLAGPATAGALHVLPSPVRVYDSRPGSTPAVGEKTKLDKGVNRAIDLTVNSSGVPKDATAAMVNLLIVGASPGDANFTLWKNGVAKPSSNTMVWGGSVGRFSTLAVTALDSAGRAQVATSVRTDVVLDVVGYYR
ncbi:MAG: hypothetical protein JWO77_2815 [Ilumatobacteraceae bacterium]|nr:hypothetical protein [Ilumatobacteraceae bacterium]